MEVPDLPKLSVRSLALVGTLLALLVAPGFARADTIAYSCGYDICLINPDNPGEGTKLIETSTVQERSPAWSPGGEWIAYVGQLPGKPHDVFVIDPTQSAAEIEATNISDNDDTNANFETPPAWSPDGTRVAYFEEWFSGGLTNDVFVSPFDGTADQVPIGQTTAGETFPSWTPDGRVVFGRNAAAYIGNADGFGTPTLVPSSTGLQPSMSPNGKYIAMEDAGGYPYEVRIVKADGSGSYPLSKAGDGGPDFDWSPDGNRLAYVNDEEPSGGPGALDQVWVAPADGSSPGNAVPMPPGWIVPHNPSFSPDGTRVAFNARTSSGLGFEQILVGPADGSAPAVPITSTAANNQEPDWKPGPGGPKPPTGPGGGGPGGGGAGGGGSAGGGSGAGGGGATQGTKTPVKIRLAYLKAPVITPKFMTPVSIDCHAQGGNPTGWVAEFCAANASAYPQGAAAQSGFRPWWAAAAKAKPKPVLFASGKVKVPVGKTKPLKMKLTAAGKKLLKTGKTIKVKLELKLTRPGAKAQRLSKTVTIKP